MSSNHEPKHVSENSLDNKKEIHINNLNDDCLLEVFKNLTATEKLEASFVCARWGFLLAKNLHISDELINEIVEKTEEALPFIINFIKTCGSYLNSLKIEGYLIAEGIEVLIKEASENCKNLHRLEIYRKYSIFEEDDLGVLFENNVNLCIVSLEGLNLNDKILTKLKTNKIEELNIRNCKFTVTSHLVNFLSKLKNVEKLKISLIGLEEFLDKGYYILKGIEMEAVKALNESHCENITEFYLELEEYDQENIIDLKNLLSKQKKLRKLTLINLKIDEHFLECLSKRLLCVLELDSIENPINYSFHEYQNLKVLKWSNFVITDEFLKGLAECKNLKELSLLNIQDYLLTETGEKNFCEMESLESFKISMLNDKIIDKILIGLSQCANLKSIDISKCQLTDVGFKSLYAYSKLSELNVSGTNITNEQLKELVKNSQNLMQLDVSWCPNLSEDIIQEIKEVNSTCAEQHALKILYDPDIYKDDYDSSNSDFDYEDYYDSNDDYEVYDDDEFERFPDMYYK